MTKNKSRNHKSSNCTIIQDGCHTVSPLICTLPDSTLRVVRVVLMVSLNLPPTKILRKPSTEEMGKVKRNEGNWHVKGPTSNWLSLQRFTCVLSVPITKKLTSHKDKMLKRNEQSVVRNNIVTWCAKKIIVSHQPIVLLTQIVNKLVEGLLSVQAVLLLPALWIGLFTTALICIVWALHCSQTQKEYVSTTWSEWGTASSR